MISDRLPPQNLEAEAGALGSILLENDALDEIAAFLTPDDFYRAAHQTLYRAVLDLYARGEPADAVSVAELLTRRGQYKDFGGEEMLRQIIDGTPNAANAVYYAQIVRQKAVSRRLIDVANRILDEGYSNNFTADQLLQSAERQIFEAVDDRAQGDPLSLAAVVNKSMDRIIARSESGETVTGVGTGYFDLDDMIGGFQDGQLTILAARPSMGKTAIALCMAEHAAASLGRPVLFVSLEMSDIEIGDRMICMKSKVDGYKLRTGQNLAGRDMNDLIAATEKLRRAPMFIDDTPTQNMIRVAGVARRLKKRSGLAMVFVDYVQLVDAESARDSRQEQIARISARLRALARELSVPVVALSQLNRAVENREDKRPRMADLRESGAIEQDAHNVLLLHRPEYYDPADRPGEAELIVAKNRNGPTGTVVLTFRKNLARFESVLPAGVIDGPPPPAF